ncbi:hypothetical protein ACFQ21_04630 [Ohtaekwangia kribbensis]|jgi:hypothetical protein|uniref:Lipoprotein n=1 Tax=Ohtaekwangia kribbensis TaxID=688913 RepID=A0ABW3JZI6_9BACT
MSKCVALVVLMVVVAQCTVKDKRSNQVTILPPELSDPYLQSFRNKNIRFIVFERIGEIDPRPDTIELDVHGNVVSITGPYEREKRAYDARDFLVKRMMFSDFSVQYIARYSVRGDTLIQTMRECNSRDWNLHGDTTTRPYKVNFFVLDSEGKVTQEFDDGFGPLMYIYSESKLVRKEIEVSLNSDDEYHWETTAEYNYYENGEIKDIKEFDRLKKEFLFFFSKGLLDSSRVTRYIQDMASHNRYKYRYIYY